MNYIYANRGKINYFISLLLLGFDLLSMFYINGNTEANEVMNIISHSAKI